MQNKFIIIGLAFIVAAGTIIACNSSAANEKEQKPLSQEELVQRGSYLVNAVGCDDCHSPKKMGPHGPEVIPDLRFSGYPSERPLQKVDTNSVKNGWSMFGSDFTSTLGPWGISFAANITSDATGIGNWKEEQFMKAIREGKSKGLEGNRDLLPPMPWFVYRNFSDEDIKAIFAYLKSTKPVKNVVPAPKGWKELK
jgi:Cytochrome c